MRIGLGWSNLETAAQPSSPVGASAVRGLPALAPGPPCLRVCTVSGLFQLLVWGPPRGRLPASLTNFSLLSRVQSFLQVFTATLIFSPFCNESVPRAPQSRPALPSPAFPRSSHRETGDVWVSTKPALPLSLPLLPSPPPSS